MITTVKSKSMLIVKNMRYFAVRIKFHVRTTYSARYSVKIKPQDNSDIGQARDWCQTCQIELLLEGTHNRAGYERNYHTLRHT